MNHVPRILLIEDDDRDAELAMAALEEHQPASQIIRLRDGAQALDYLFRRGHFAHREQGQPAVVILDLKMPGIDGFQLLRQVKAHPDLKRIPAVVLTSSREHSDILNSYELGVNAYVVKPLKFPDFVDAVKQVGVFWAAVNEPPPSSQNQVG